MQEVCSVDAHSRPQKCQSWAHEPQISPLRGLHGLRSWRGRFLRQGRARKERLLASEKSRPATRSSAALVRLGDAQEAPSNRRLRAAWLARVRPRWCSSSQWAWLKPHPELLAEGAAIAVALHDHCRRVHRPPPPSSPLPLPPLSLRRAAAAAACAGPGPHIVSKLP